LPIVFLIAALALLSLRHERQLVLANALRATVLAPVLTLHSGLAVSRVLRAELEELRAARDSFATQVVALRGVEEENMRLRALLGLVERGRGRFLPANVWPSGRPGEGVKTSFVIDLGRSAGVRENAPVVAAGGLVGVVRAALARQASGDYWTHRDFRVSAMTADGLVFGIVRPVGDGEVLMQLDGAPFQVELAPGTEIVTSGQGSVFPRGIPIGWVVELQRAEAGWAKSYLVRPAVYPEAAREVMVLTSERPGEGAGDLWTQPESP
jgi:rod shape-determining protein MreC